MSYSLLLLSLPLLLPLSLFFLSSSSFSSFTFCLLSFSFSLSYLRSIHPSRSPAVAVFDRNSISTESPLSPTAPCLSLSLSLHSRLPSLLLPSLHSGNPEDSRKEATGCIPRDKLRGSIIHGNLLLRLCLKTWMLFSRFHATFPRRENDIESR